MLCTRTVGPWNICSAGLPFVRHLVLIARALLALTLLYSGAIKLLGPFAFLDAVLRYELVGPTIATVVAATLPWVEVVCGVLLLPRRSAVAAGWVAFALGAVFILAQASALLRGLEIGCGCVRGPASEPIGVLSLARAGVVLLGGLAIAVLSQTAESRRLTGNSPQAGEGSIAA